MLGPFSQSLDSTVLDEKSKNLLLFLFICAALNYYCATVTEMGIFLYCCLRISNTVVLSLMYHALTSA